MYTGRPSTHILRQHMPQDQHYAMYTYTTHVFDFCICVSVWVGVGEHKFSMCVCGLEEEGSQEGDGDMHDEIGHASGSMSGVWESNSVISSRYTSPFRTFLHPVLSVYTS